MTFVIKTASLSANMVVPCTRETTVVDPGTLSAIVCHWPSTLCIRNATTADLGATERNINAVCDEGLYLVPSHFVMPERWRRILAAGGELDNDLIVVAEVDGHVVGHGRLFTTPGTSVHVADLGIAIIAEYRNRGIGSRMIACLLDWARHKELRKVTLGVFASNLQAIHVYQKFGFTIEGVLRQQHRVGGEYVDEIVMAHFLENHAQTLWPRLQLSGTDLRLRQSLPWLQQCLRAGKSLPLALPAPAS